MYHNYCNRNSPSYFLSLDFCRNYEIHNYSIIRIYRIRINRIIGYIGQIFRSRFFLSFVAIKKFGNIGSGFAYIGCIFRSGSYNLVEIISYISDERKWPFGRTKKTEAKREWDWFPLLPLHIAVVVRWERKSVWANQFSFTVGREFRKSTVYDTLWF